MGVDSLPSSLLALVLAGGWGVGPSSPPPVPLLEAAPAEVWPPAAVGTAGPAWAAGRIEGTVRLPRRAPRRTASRYPGAAPPGAHPVQELPAVVYLRGTFSDAAPSPSGLAVMAQEDTTFAPPILVVPVGAAVEFPNRDPFFHNVFSYSSARRFDLGRYPQGRSKSVTFGEPGIVKIYCEVHDFMRAAVVVVENPFHAVVGEDGEFSLDGVPPGRHTLVVWHADGGSEEVEVEVPDGGTARVTVDLT